MLIAHPVTSARCPVSLANSVRLETSHMYIDPSVEPAIAVCPSGLRGYQKIGIAATIRTAFMVNLRNIRRTAAILIMLSLDLVVRSYSLLNRRWRFSQANVRSTIHRFGWT